MPFFHEFSFKMEKHHLTLEDAGQPLCLSSWLDRCNSTSFINSADGQECMNTVIVSTKP